MKRFSFLFLSISSLLFIGTLTAQTGPGGVGNSSNNVVWLDASQLSLSDNDPVANWTEISGNGNDATQTTPAEQPLFKTNQLNGLPAIEFDGSNDFFNLASNVTTDEITNFIVYSRLGGSSLQGLLTYNKHVLFSNNGKFTTFYANPNSFYNVSKSDLSFSIVSHFTDASLSGSDLTLTDANSSQLYTRNELVNVTGGSKIGLNAGNNRFFNGQVAEVITYNEELNTARRNIISEYLGAKYNLTSLSSLYAYGSTYGNNVIGLGQESSGNHTIARGQDSLLISNPSSLDNGDYIFIGNDGAGYGTNAVDVPGGVVERWDQVWRVDKTGTPGTINLEFFLGSNGFSSVSNYVILIENVDGDFSNGGTSLQGAGTASYNATNNSIIFSNINLPGDSYFTLAEASGEITAIASGDWSNPLSWDCNCVPQHGDVVNIGSPFASLTINVDANAAVRELNISSGGALSFSGDDTLSIYSDFNTATALNLNSGTLAFLGSGTQQEFNNTSSSGSMELNNLWVNNANGLAIIFGDWGLSGNLQVSSGGMDVSSSNSFTLRSTPTATSQILGSMDSAFSGNFIVQRYISPRNADWANFSSPVENATVADWDDDLYISGVSGNDGNATDGAGGPIFYTLYWFNWWTDEHLAVTDVSEALLPGRGYDIYLGDNTTSYFGDTIDVVGVPNTGDVVGTGTRINKGWNLMGNPYHSFIDYDAINFNGTVPDNYYIFNTDNGSYDFFSGAGKPPIASGQAFWIFKSNNGIVEAVISESSKVNSNSSTFLRKKAAHDPFQISIHNQQNPFKHQLNIDFNAHSTEELDEKDAFYLPSRQEGAPAIYSKAANSEEGLILNSLNPFEESQVVPIEVYAGAEGKYEINAEQVDQIYEHYSCIYLKDKEKSEAIDLSVQPNYQFEATEGKHDRFELILSNSFANCEKLIKEDQSVQQKLDESLSLRRSESGWFLDYTLGEELQQVEVQVFNTAGQTVLQGISFSASGAGNYPLQELQNLKGIYLIQVKTADIFFNKTIQL